VSKRYLLPQPTNRCASSFRRKCILPPVWTCDDGRSPELRTISQEANIERNFERMSWNQLLDDTRLRVLRGGERSVTAPGEARSEFERDRDRTVYSSPVRRLIGKTQVFPLDPNDHVRTRLVHSLEVSTVAEGLTSQVVRDVISKKETLSDVHSRAISKIAETCGLLHDAGNPPFGHAGELAIASWFQSRLKADTDQKGGSDTLFAALGGSDTQLAQDFLRFEGNAQTMRIIANSHLLGHDLGLNLTCATNAAARKYLASSTTADKKSSNHALTKPGYFSSEEPLLSMVGQCTGTQGRRHPVTFLVEAADDIVYSVVDIEDGVKKRILNWRQVEPRFKSIPSRTGQNAQAVEIVGFEGNRFRQFACSSIPCECNQRNGESGSDDVRISLRSNYGW